MIPTAASRVLAPATKTRLAAAATLLAVSLAAPTAASAEDNFSNLEVRGLTPSMTFAEVQAHLKENWPNARMRIRHNRLRHANTRYEYASYIEINDRSPNGREVFRINFLPPENISDNPESVTVKRLNRGQSIKQNPITRDNFIKQLSDKYGKPSFIRPTKLEWVFDKDRQLLSQKKLTAQRDAAEQKCEKIRKEAKAHRDLLKSGQTPKGYKLRTTELYYAQRDCDRELARLKTCFNYAHKKYCPHRMIAGWSENSQTVGFVPRYDINIYSMELDQLEKDRLTTLQDQLKQKAVKESKEKTKSGTKLKL